MTTCSVCINTYKRPHLIAETLESLGKQVMPDDVELEVIVVDNDGDMSGAETVERCRARHAFNIRYLCEPQKNISLARNKAVTEAGGNYLLFMDDDEQADPYWIDQMLSTLHRFDADAVFGRVIPIFHADAPEWLTTNALFLRPCRPTGTPLNTGRTSNALVKASLLDDLDVIFDADYGTTGGEDSDLFERLAAGGANFVSCYEGVVTEYVPRDRTTVAWLVDRAKRTGMLHAHRRLRRTEQRSRTLMALVPKAATGYLLAQVMMLKYNKDRSRWLDWKVRAASYQGHLLGSLGQTMDGY